MSFDSDSLKEKLMLKYGNRLNRFLQLVIKYVPFYDSERRDELVRAYRKELDRDIMIEFRQNMLDSQKLTETLRTGNPQGSMMDPDVWLELKMSELN